MMMITKRRLLRHAVSSMAVFALVVYVLRRPLMIVFQPRDEFAIHPNPQPLPTSAANLRPEPRPQLIPKIIHQVYDPWNNRSLPDDWAANRQSCMRLHPDYEFNLWNGETAERLLETEYPWFLDTYHGYSYPIQRVDAIRYFILLKYGGIYLDMDMGCIQSLDSLLGYPAFMSAASFVGVTNSIMGAMPGHSYITKLTRSLTSYAINWGFPYLTVMNAAGPHFVSFVWIDYINGAGRWSDGNDLDKVHLLMPRDRSHHEGSFFYEGRGKSWHNWDNFIFACAHRHPYLTTSLVLPIVVVLYGLLWTAWSVLTNRKKRVAWPEKDQLHTPEGSSAGPA